MQLIYYDLFINSMYSRSHNILGIKALSYRPGTLRRKSLVMKKKIVKAFAKAIYVISKLQKGCITTGNTILHLHTYVPLPF